MRSVLKPCKVGIRAVVPLLFILSVSRIAGGVPQDTSRDETIDSQRREAIVRRVASEFREKYLFADVAEKMALLIEKKFASGEYDSIKSLRPFTAQLQEDLRSVSKDRHVKVLPGLVPDFDADPLMMRRENYGFTAVEILPGNIGYVDFFQFYSVKDAGPTAIAAMNFLAGCDALIIDLRSNGGGYPELRSLICSYFFTEPTCLIEFRHRQGVTQDWALTYVPGPRMPEIPIFILISRSTFSCAEDFSFCLQNLGRAKVIGENTRGGAHDAKLWRFPDESISLQIPFNEAVDPKTKKTWEGVGIRPDIQVQSDQAFEVGVQEAAMSLLASSKEDNRKFLMQWIMDDFRSQLEPPSFSPGTLRVYTGVYGSYKVVLKGDLLFLHFNEQLKWQLIPFAADVFKLDNHNRHGYATHRVQFTRDGRGKVKSLFILEQEGNRFPIQSRK